MRCCQADQRRGRVNSLCLRNELLDALSERARLWDCVPSDLGTLAGTREGSVGLAELVGDPLRDDVADLVRGGGGESPQLLEGQKLLFGCQEIRVCCAWLGRWLGGWLTYGLERQLKAFRLLVVLVVVCRHLDDFL